MTIFPPPPRRFDASVPEMMDRLGNDPALIRGDLTVLATINRWLGGYRIPLAHLERCRADRLTVLDLATGGGDIPRAVVRWARKAGVTIRVTAVDFNPEILAIARERSQDYPEISYEQQNLLDLPYGHESFDIVLNSLTLHHFEAEQASFLLRRIHEIARRGYVVNDLCRRWSTVVLSRWMARLVIRNPIARFDAPVSCERAFTVAEAEELCRQAGLPARRLTGWWGMRWVLAAKK